MSELIGRTVEFDALVRALEQARGGRGSVILVGGEAGIGKTALIDELRAAAEARSVPVWWGRTPEASWADPYAPWIEALDRGGGFPEAVISTGTALSAEDAQAQLHDRIVRHIAERVERQPAVLVLEDLHWARPEALELLRHVAFANARRALLICVTYRDSMAAPHLPLGQAISHLRRESAASDVQLGGLSATDVARLVVARTGTRITPAQRSRIVAETNGNPLFAIELGRDIGLRRDQSDQAQEELESDPQRSVPLAVRQAIGQRFERLSPATQQVISTGSIVGDEFDIAIVAALTGMTDDAVISALDEATAEGFVTAGIGPDQFAFSHSIVKHAILANWQPARLVRERRRIAELLIEQNRRDRAGEIATHFHASRSLPDAETGLPFALEAAQTARDNASHAQNVAYLRMARDLLPAADPELQLGAILKQLAVAEAEYLEIEPAIKTGWNAVDWMDAHSVAADEIADFLNQIAVALKHRAGATIDQWSPFVTLGLQRADAARGLGWARLNFVLDPVEPISRSGVRAGIWKGFDPEAIAIARSEGSEEDQARSFESFDSRTREETEALLRLGRGFRNPAARMHVLTVAANDLQYSHGAFADATRVWQEIERLAERHSAVAWQAQATNQITLLHIAAGEFAEADRSESQANALLARLGPGRRPDLFSFEMKTARACYLVEDFAPLANFWIAFADDPSLGAGETGSLLGPFFAAVGAFTAAEAGDHASSHEVLALLTPLLQRLPLDASNQNGAVAFAALAAWTLRDKKLAVAYRELIGRMIAAGRQDYPQTSLQLSVARMNALLDRTEEAANAFSIARQELETSGQLPLRAIVDYEEAAWLLERSRPDLERAADLATRALEQFELLGMAIWSEKAQIMRDAIAQKAGPASYPAGLSEREVEVLKLAVQGQSDKEISDALFISPRTVNAHMRNMFAKTGASNRTDLSVWAIGQGLVSR